MTTKLPVRGTCRCGDVEIEVGALPFVTSACHCTGCQQMTSSAFSLTASVPSEAFSITAGEPIVGGLHGGSKHMFCPRCLTWMFTHPEGMDYVVNVRPTMLNDCDWTTPFIEVFTSEKLPWANTPATHRYETVPPFEKFDELIAEYAKTQAAS